MDQGRDLKEVRSHYTESEAKASGNEGRKVNKAIAGRLCVPCQRTEALDYRQKQSTAERATQRPLRAWFFPQRVCIGRKGLLRELQCLLSHVCASSIFSPLKDALLEG